MPDQVAREGDDLVGDAAVQHQLAGEDEERDRQEREHVHPGDHALERGRERKALDQVGEDAGQRDGERDRDAQQQEDREADAKNGQGKA